MPLTASLSMSYWHSNGTQAGLTPELVASTMVRHFSLSIFQTPPRLWTIQGTYISGPSTNPRASMRSCSDCSLSGCSSAPP